jgi:hypothetical protein
MNGYQAPGILQTHISARYGAPGTSDAASKMRGFLGSLFSVGMTDLCELLAAYGFCVGRKRTSLTKDCDAWVVSMATT